MIPEKIYIGEDEVLKQYIGDALSWEKPSEPDPDPFPTDVWFDPNYGTFTERTGDIETLTPASVDGPVGTWVSHQGHVVRAPSDAARMTLRELAGGNRVLEKTAVGQKYVSDDAASMWKWLHDGTVYSQAISFHVTGNNNTKLFPLWTTYNGSTNTVGAAALYDNRIAVSSTRHLLRFAVTRGVNAQPVISSTASFGVAGGKWQMFMGFVDPTATPATSRVKQYNFGLIAGNNEVGYVVSAADPQSTLIIGAYAESTLQSSYSLGYIGSVIFYNGEWSSGDIQNIEEYYDFDGAGRFEVITPAASISGQVYPYEAFPTLTRLQNGNLLAAWRSAGTHLDKGVSTTAISTDNGSTWTKHHGIISDTVLDFRSPHMFQLSSGDILAATARRHPDTEVFSDPSISISTDGGQTFSPYTTVPIPDGHTVLFPFGRWHYLGSTILAPFYLIDDEGTNISEVWQSTDEGLTWSQRSVIGAGGLNESSIIHLTGSTWLACCRQQAAQRITIAVSSDDCITWTNQTNTGYNGASPQLFRVGDTIYCAVSDRDAPGGIGILVWTDGWLHEPSPEHPIYESIGWSSDIGYPGIVVDGQVVSMVFYDEYDTTDPGVKFMRFNAPDFGSVL